MDTLPVDPPLENRVRLVCERCGWEWLKRAGRPDPKRCANPRCRSMLWRGETPAPQPVEGQA